MKLPDKWYDILKWISMICIDAIATFYVAMAGIWGWPYGDEVAKTATAVSFLIGSLIGISTASYYKDGK